MHGMGLDDVIRFINLTRKKYKMVREDLGEKVAASGINWGEVGLRVTMTLIHTAMVVTLLLLVSGNQQDEQLTTFLLVACLIVAAFGCYQLVPLARAVWQSSQVTIYQNGISYQDRNGERSWAWHELSHFEVLKGFGYTGYGTYLSRHGLLIVYTEDEVAFQIDRLFWNAPKIAHIIVKSMPTPTPKGKVKEEPVSTVHPLF